MESVSNEPSNAKNLAKSANYMVKSEFEIVLLYGNDRNVVIGDFYGNPTAAVIDAGERWCVMVGCGIIAYYLEAPFRPYEYATDASNWAEWHRDPLDVWWVNNVEQVATDVVKFRIHDADPHAGDHLLTIPPFRHR